MNSRLYSLRAVNKQLEKKVDTGKEDKRPQTAKKETLQAKARVKQLEKYSAELEDKLAFTVDKFEEQN